MNRLSVIVPVHNGEKYLEKTLECLITQTVENFEVIIIDDGSTDTTAEIAKKYCEDYDGFYYIYQEHKGVYAARNTGIEKAKCEYLLFLDCGDVITDGTVEAIFTVSDERDADIITGRCWKNGDIEYEYDKSLDILATQPEIDMMESRLLYCQYIGAKVFRKKLFDLYNIRFLDFTAYGEILLTMQCIFKSGKISGCPDFILEKTVKHIEDGYSQFEMPTLENIKSAKYVLSELFEMGKELIIEQTGNFDGDEAYIQEIIYMIYRFYLENFYRKYWYMTPETIFEMKNDFEKYAQFVQPERFKKLQQANQDIRLPYIYIDKSEAAKEPEFTLLFDIANELEYQPMLRSLYAQSYPFFEIIVSESKYNSEYFPEEFKHMENLVVLPDNGFHTKARSIAKSKNYFVIKKGTPIDIRTLRETAQSKAPAFMKQYVFSKNRSEFNARKVLKDKGLNLN